MATARLDTTEVLTASQTLAAFRSATGMGVRLCRTKLATPLYTCENSFCHLMRLGEDRPTPCQAVRTRIADSDGLPVVTRHCAAGLEHVAMPLPGPGEAAGWIESGQVFLIAPRREDFASFCQRHPGWRESDVLPELEAAFFATPVLTRERLEAGTKLLRLIARELEPLVQNQALVRSGPARDPVEKARHYVTQKLSEGIRLCDVARHVDLCPAHLCRVFKRRTGQTLGDFVADARVERAKRLLAQAGGRAVDVAYAVGFQSVRQFNHVFKARTQLTPSAYRRSCQSASEIA